MRTCAVTDQEIVCGRYAPARGLCTKHYARWRTHGDPTVVTRRGSDRDANFWAKVDKTETCWLWTGAMLNGYGKFWAGKTVFAHRWSYERFIGPIPKGLHLDHLCRVPACVRPDHLEAVTNRENVLRSKV
jgi:hypothetical protein